MAGLAKSSGKDLLWGKLGVEIGFKGIREFTSCSMKIILKQTHWRFSLVESQQELYLIFREIDESDFLVLAPVIKRVFDNDAQKHLGKER